MTTEVSPSGKYVLTIEAVLTQPRYSNHSKGVVQRVGWEIIAEVNRNFSWFPFLWVENHPNGHDYLVCGADYQGQTVIELDTGRRRDFIPEAAKDGFGFCWAEYTFDSATRILAVEGCIWACPYEYRFYDFSDPLGSGWPEIELKDACIYAEGKAPTIHEDGTINTYDTRARGDLEGKKYETWEDADEERVVVAIGTFKVNGHELIPVSEWVEEEEQRRRSEEQASREKWQKEWEEYKKTDPIFLCVQDRVKLPPFGDQKYSLSTGQCYDGWHPTEKFQDSRVCKDLLRTKNLTATVEWGRKHAPIKLILHKDDKSSETKWYSHSVDGMNEALDYAVEVSHRKDRP